MNYDWTRNIANLMPNNDEEEEKEETKPGFFSPQGTASRTFGVQDLTNIFSGGASRPNNSLFGALTLPALKTGMGAGASGVLGSIGSTAAPIAGTYGLMKILQAANNSPWYQQLHSDAMNFTQGFNFTAGQQSPNYADRYQQTATTLPQQTGSNLTPQQIAEFASMVGATALPNAIQQATAVLPGQGTLDLGGSTTTGERKEIPGALPDVGPVEIPDTTPIDATGTVPGVVPDNIPIDTTGTRTGTGEEALKFLERSTTGNNNQQKKDEQPKQPKKDGTWKKIGVGAVKKAPAIVGGGLAVAGMSNILNTGEEDVIDTEERVPGLFEDDGNFFTEITPEDMAALRTQEILEGLQNQQISATEAYSDLYARAMQSSFRRSAAMSDPFTGVGGGQRAQGREALSAAEIAQMGAIGSDFNQVLRDIEMARIAAPEEGRQAAFEQEERRQMQNERAVQRTIRIIDMLNNSEISQEQMTMFLRAEGLGEDKIREILKIREESKGSLDWNKILRNLGITALLMTSVGWKPAIISGISAGGVAGFGQTVQGEDWFQKFTENWPNWLKEGLFGIQSKQD